MVRWFWLLIGGFCKSRRPSARAIAAIGEPAERAMPACSDWQSRLWFSGSLEKGVKGDTPPGGGV